MNNIIEKQDIAQIDFNKMEGKLIPAVIQDQFTNKVLMVGFMNEAALKQTIDTKLVTFFSRSRQTLWTKGESSNNFLHLIEIKSDCDNDTLLIKVKPDGPVCHTGSDTCFKEINEFGISFLNQLEGIISERKLNPSNESYTSSLFKKGINAIAQKVGEEAVELIIEAKDENEERFKDEAADLLYHYLILLQAKGFLLKDIIQLLEHRNKNH